MLRHYVSADVFFFFLPLLFPNSSNLLKINIKIKLVLSFTGANRIFSFIRTANR